MRHQRKQWVADHAASRHLVLDLEDVLALGAGAGDCRQVGNELANDDLGGSNLRGGQLHAAFRMVFQAVEKLTRLYEALRLVVVKYFSGACGHAWNIAPSGMWLSNPALWECV